MLMACSHCTMLTFVLGADFVEHAFSLHFSILFLSLSHTYYHGYTTYINIVFG